MRGHPGPHDTSLKQCSRMQLDGKDVGIIYQGSAHRSTSDEKTGKEIKLTGPAIQSLDGTRTSLSHSSGFRDRGIRGGVKVLEPLV